MRASLIEIEQFFKSFLDSIGHPLIGELKFDSESWERYSCPNSSNQSNQNVSYKAHSDNIPVIKIQCHKCFPDKVLTHKYEAANTFTSDDWKKFQNENAKKIAEKKRKEAIKREEALTHLRATFDKSLPCIDHAYLSNKRVIATADDGLRIRTFDNALLCPVRTITGELISGQKIKIGEPKKFFDGTSPKSGFHVLGKLENVNEFILSESIGTGLTIKEALNHSVICVYGKSNFLAASLALQSKYPKAKFTFVCDLDSDGGSEKCAKKAILSLGVRNAKYVLPDFSTIPNELNPEIKKSDFNDLFVLLMEKGLNRTAALEQVRQQLTSNLIEVIMTENEKEKKARPSKKEERPKAAEILLQLIDQEQFEFFHNENQEAFCKYPSQKSSVYEVRRVNDVRFKNYLSFIYRKAKGKTIGEPALKEAIAEMEGRALHDSKSKQHKVFLRVGELNKKIYIDLCNDKWQVIEISSTGWKVLDSKDVPVRFERSQHALPLPDPSKTETADINLLWQIVNIPKEDQVLVLAFILECYRYSTAFPILTLLGLQDSGKSATQNTLRSLIDPSSSNLRTAPRKVDDLVVEAISNWLVSYNNVSHLTDDMHDDFCCVATGSGFATRKFFTNIQQIVVNIARPVIINGIFNFIRRPDLLDRAIILELDSIDESKRKTDAQLNKAVLESLPSIFRGLMDLLVKVLQLLPSVRLDKQPRMADFSLLGVAVEKALGLPENIFINRYRANRANAKEGILDSSPIMLALAEFIERQDNKFWRGRPSELLEELTKFKNPSTHTAWPKTAHAMGGELKRYIAPLKGIGIEVVSEAKLTGIKNRNGNFYRISKVNEPSKSQDAKTSPPYPPSPQSKKEPNSDEALKEFDEMDMGVDIAQEPSTKSTQSPPVNSPVKPHDACISSGSVDSVDFVDMKTQLDASGDADDNSMII